MVGLISRRLLDAVAHDGMAALRDMEVFRCVMAVLLYTEGNTQTDAHFTPELRNLILRTFLERLKVSKAAHQETG